MNKFSEGIATINFSLGIIGFAGCAITGMINYGIYNLIWIWMLVNGVAIIAAGDGW